MKITIYKTLIISIIFVVFGSICLCLNPYYFGNTVWRKIGTLALTSGIGLAIISEVIFSVHFVKEQSKMHLRTEIQFFGFVSSLFAFILIAFVVTYAIPVTDSVIFVVAGVIVCIMYMMLLKHRLAKSGATIGKAVSIISIGIVIVVVSAYILTATCFEYIVYESIIRDLPLLCEVRDYAAIYSIDTTRERSLMYVYILSTTPLFISVLMNYIELIVKSKKMEF